MALRITTQHFTQKLPAADAVGASARSGILFRGLVRFVLPPPHPRPVVSGAPASDSHLR